MYRTLRGLINFAIKQGLIEGVDPMRGIDNPKPYKPASKVNAANESELRAFLKCLDASNVSTAAKLVIEMQLLTGARPGEVRLMEWSEINAGGAEWTVPAARSKSGREHRIHLSIPAIDLLAEAKLALPRGTFVFPGSTFDSEGMPRSLDKHAISRALRRLTSKPNVDSGRRLSPHDLRRTFRTACARLGIAPHIAEACLNHQEKETMRRVYDGHDYSSEMAEAWNKAGEHIRLLRKS